MIYQKKHAWETRNVKLGAFEQDNVEVPAHWSQTATNILASKYLRGQVGTTERETSLKQVLDRVVGAIVTRGKSAGYNLDAEFGDRLRSYVIEQKASFNSPVWFNIGVKGVPQQASACFILSVDDSMDSILNWYRDEGIIFKGGSGAGVNLSNIRSSQELLSGGGTASGPVSFMRGADASAGAIKSGGKTRRAAKMVILDVDHPDIEEFVWCKAVEERKALALRQAGFDMGMNGTDAFSVQYQNANNSVWVTDAFMEAVCSNANFPLKARKDRSTAKDVNAKSLLHQIAEAAWECGDPGIGFANTINSWHTVPNAGRIHASNPCGEFVFLDNTACNLASINVAKFVNDGIVDVDGLIQITQDLITAQDILVDLADYPTDAIRDNSHLYRPLGLGIANLASALMSAGIPYDSDQGRSLASTVMGVVTGSAWKQSARLATWLGVSDAPDMGYGDNIRYTIQKHIDAAAEMGNQVIVDVFSDALRAGTFKGYRNAQVTLVAPTGTISFLMDCDSTGIEPVFAVESVKQLVGGGKIVTHPSCVEDGLKKLGLSSVDDAGDNPVFACASGQNTVSVEGHLKMMAAIQPFISGAISKTVNVPESFTAEDIENVYIQAWKLGLKSVTVYRDGSKVDQPMSGTNKAEVVSTNTRRKLPHVRQSHTYSFKVGESQGYLTAGEYPDGSLGEIFIKVSKQGSTLAGVLDALAISVSMGLQYGVPLDSYVHQFSHMRFEPAGITDDEEIRFASSLVDYIFRRLAMDYLQESGEFIANEKVEDVGTTTVATSTEKHGSVCMSCGGLLIRSGSCMVCTTCGTTTGCS